jgi:hypothetical protein
LKRCAIEAKNVRWHGRSGLIAWKAIKKKFADVKCQIGLTEEVGYHWPGSR